MKQKDTKAIHALQSEINSLRELESIFQKKVFQNELDSILQGDDVLFTKNDKEMLKKTQTKIRLKLDKLSILEGIPY